MTNWERDKAGSATWTGRCTMTNAGAGIFGKIMPTLSFKKHLLAAILPCLLACSAPKSLGQNPTFSLDELQRRHFNYFWKTAHPTNFQIPDRWPTDNFSSIAATGFGLSTYLVGAERGWITREQAAERVLNTLLFLKNLPQGEAVSGVAGYRGWFYHFLQTQTGLRFQQVELSSIDTGLLMAGILSCMTYFDHENPSEKSIRETADWLYRRVEFDWFLNDNQRLSMGWHPEKGFLAAEWSGYNEAMILLLEALGSPTHPVPAKAWEQWCARYYRTEFQGQDMVNFGPLFGHQYSHCWVDFRGIRDAYNSKVGFDYFENSRRATLAQHAYCIENQRGFIGYGPKIWGLTAGDGPDADMVFNGKDYDCPGYTARGVAADYRDDDGTIAPTAALASMPFAPEIVLPTAEEMWHRWPVGEFGFFDGYNESFTEIARSPKAQPGQKFWVDKDYLGIDQGPIVLMLENHRSQFLWNLMKRNPYIVQGLRRAGFRGGWLESVDFQKLTKNIAWANGEETKPNPEIPLDPKGFFQREMFTGKDGGKLPYAICPPDPEVVKPGTHWSSTGKVIASGPFSGPESLPLVVFLHGSGERGTDNDLQLKNGVFAFCEKENREQHPCFLLVPQCPEGQWWGLDTRKPDADFAQKPQPQAGQLVLELIEKTLAEYPEIDPNRVYLTGLSMGGFGTFDLISRRPDLFAAAMPLCGGGSVGQVSQFKNLPIWVFHGSLDDAVPVKFSREMVAALKAGGSSVRYTEFTTKGHDVWEVTYYNPAVLDWLFEQRRN